MIFFFNNINPLSKDCCFSFARKLDLTFNATFLRLVCALLYCSFGSTNPIWAQDYVVNKFSHISTSDQFSLNSVTCIAQDKKGLIWFGTATGLMRFDGNELKDINSKNNGLTAVTNINDIQIDKAGKIWIGADKGLWIYDPVLDKVQRFLVSKNRDSLTFVRCIKQMANGEMWLGTNTGLSIYNPKNKKFTNISHQNVLSFDRINCLYQKADGTIWIGTDGGLHRFIEIKDKKFKVKAFKYNASDNNSISNDNVNVVLEDKASNLWIGTQAGLDYLNVKTNKFAHLSKNLTSNIIRALTIDKGGRLWVGTYDGISLVDSFKVTNQIKHNPDLPLSLVDNKIKFLFTDNYGSVWIGSYYGGINYWNEKQLNFSKIDEGKGSKLGFKVVSSILEDQGDNIYFGTEGEGISVFNTQKNTFKYINQLDNNEKIGAIKTMLLTGTDQLWIGTFNSGLIHYNTKTTANTVYKHLPKDKNSISSNKIISIEKGLNGEIWIGTLNDGLNLLMPNSNKFIRIKYFDSDTSSTKSKTIRDLLTDHSGNLYVGTPSGLYTSSLLKKQDGGNLNFKEVLFADKQHVGKINLQDIFQDKQGRIWVGTMNFGLLIVKNGKLLETGITKDIIVNAVVEDQNNSLWLSTNKGIIKYNHENKSAKTYNINDGIEANAFSRGSKLYSKNGRIYFGGASGVITFNPTKLRNINRSAPKIVITSFKLFDKPVKVGDSTSILEKSITDTKKLRLEYDQNIFTINFSMPNYILHGKKVYQYRLKGLDDKWTLTSNPAVSFTIQQGGKYIFEVKGTNGDGFKTSQITRLEIVVASAPWKTWWAYSIYILIILSAFVAYVYFFQSKIRLQHKLDLEIKESENQQQLNKQKLQFFTNVSHEFRTPLTLISGPLQKLIEDYKGPHKYFSPLLTIRKNTDQLTKLINELLDFRKFEDNQLVIKAAEGNIVEFLKEIFLSFQPQAKLNNYNYLFKSQEDVILVYFDADKLEKVFYNLLSNAFKHTPEKGNISLEVSSSTSEVIIEVKDSGDGMKSEELEKIFDHFYEIQGQKNHGGFKYGSGIGLAIVKSVIDLHQGKIKVSSEEGNGSNFTTYLPLGKDHLSADELLLGFKENDLSLYTPIKPIENESSMDFETNEEIERECILVVEDNLEVGMFIKNVLLDYYDVVLEENGLLGFQAAVTKQPCLIISDMMMPEMDGLELCSKIKTDVKTSHIPFILLSARTSLVYKYDGLKSGADDYLFKPFEVNELVLKCKNIINTHHRLKERFLNSNLLPSLTPTNTFDESMRFRAFEIVKNNIANQSFGIDKFGKELGISRSLLFIKIKAWTNQTPNEFILSMRMKYAATMIEQNRYSIAEIALKVGFKDQSYFSKIFKKHLDYTPKMYEEKFKNL